MLHGSHATAMGVIGLDAEGPSGLMCWLLQHLFLSLRQKFSSLLDSGCLACGILVNFEIACSLLASTHADCPHS